MIRTLYRHRSGTIIVGFPDDQLPTAVKDPQSRLWIDMQSPTDDEYTRVLSDLFHFHSLAIDDAINDVHAPKVDDYGNYLYLVFHTFTLGEERMDIETREMDLFLGPNFLITLHNHVSPNIESMWQEDYHRERGLARGTAMLLYELLDRQLDSYLPLLEQFEDRVEELGDIIFSKSDKNENELLDEILTAKTSALRLRRILWPQREALNRLVRTDYSAIPSDSRIYFHDVFDHVLRLSEMVESMCDLVNSTMSTYLAITNTRLNEIMKVLAMISTIFIPLGFLAAVFGMNFRYMPELSQPWAYPIVWAVFLVISAAMVLFFRHRRWL